MAQPTTPQANAGAPYRFAEVTAKSDTVNYTAGPANAVYITAAGDVALAMDGDGTVVVFTVSANTTLQVRHRRVHSTGTTSVGPFIALW